MKSTSMNRKITFLMLFVSLAAVPFTFTTGCAVTQSRETLGESANDKAITSKVKTALYADPVVKGNQVNVTTFRSAVQLSGFVENQAQKDRAGEIARGTSGVVEVHNDLVVPTGR